MPADCDHKKTFGFVAVTRNARFARHLAHIVDAVGGTVAPAKRTQILHARGLRPQKSMVNHIPGQFGISHHAARVVDGSGIRHIAPQRTDVLRSLGLRPKKRPLRLAAVGAIAHHCSTIVDTEGIR